MITDEQLREMFANLESDRIERTTSTNDTDKFCEAICAFANDMPGNNTPGYLVLGVRDRDRIEIQNPGGLYGAVTPETFPNQNDYRNPKIAEAMKTLGYVNRFGRGIARAQRFLEENGNPRAEFDVSQSTFFLATIREVPA